MDNKPMTEESLVLDSNLMVPAMNMVTANLMSRIENRPVYQVKSIQTSMITSQQNSDVVFRNS
jgi:hypothetical protein